MWWLPCVGACLCPSFTQVVCADFEAFYKAHRPRNSLRRLTWLPTVSSAHLAVKAGAVQPNT